MPKILLSLVLLVAILLSACGQAAPQKVAVPVAPIGQATIEASRSIVATAKAEMTKEALQTTQTFSPSTP
ncbi:MAG TPA: hypothetical protein VKF38_08985, partial [Anaerolineaceae bacterium]|nr:hypothetical protein [Anaerolineaceae bacterium]